MDCATVLTSTVVTLCRPLRGTSALTELAAGGAEQPPQEFVSVVTSLVPTEIAQDVIPVRSHNAGMCIQLPQLYQ